MSFLRHVVHTSKTHQLSSLIQHQPSSLKLTSSIPSIALTATPFTTIQTRQRSNRSRRGLYDGKDIRSGNNVSFSMNKTKRKFRPNVFHKRIYSEILDEMIQFHVTTSALRTIDKHGGLDNYLLNSRHVTEGEGWVIKQRLLQRIEHCEKIGEDVLPKIQLPKSYGGSSASEVEGESEEQVMKE